MYFILGHHKSEPNKFSYYLQKALSYLSIKLYVYVSKQSWNAILKYQSVQLLATQPENSYWNTAIGCDGYIISGALRRASVASGWGVRSHFALHAFRSWEFSENTSTRGVNLGPVCNGETITFLFNSEQMLHWWSLSWSWITAV